MSLHRVRLAWLMVVAAYWLPLQLTFADGPAPPIELPVSAVELDLPGHFDEYLRHPQHFFSGHTLRIRAEFPVVESLEAIQAVLQSQTGGLTYPLTVKKATTEFVSVETPAEAPSDTYHLTLAVNGSAYEVTLELVGTEAEGGPVVAGMPNDEMPMSPAILYQSDLDCGNCWWELAITGHPTNSNHLLVAGLSQRISHDGGLTWSPITLESPPPPTP